MNNLEIEFLEKAERIIAKINERIAEDAHTKKDFPENVFTKKIITYKEARQNYKIDMHQEEEDLILILEGDIYVNGNLDATWVDSQYKGMKWNGGLIGVLIDGNLTVNGDVIDYTDDDSIELFVTKNLECNYLHSEDGWIEIHGNLTVKYGINGVYNDGALEVNGDVCAPFIICDDHQMPTKSIDEYIFINAFSNLAEMEFGNLFKPELRKDDGYFDADSFIANVKNGKNPFIEIKE